VATILVVDDDSAIRLVLRIELTAEGHDVLEAADGREALERIAEWHPDLLLLDLMMPVMDGWEVLRELEGDDTAPPIVIISALATDAGGHVAATLRLGALDYIAKPFEPGHLVAFVDAVLRVDEDERDEYRRVRLERVSGSS
jgi:DNA-binding response OmpR family regulator